MKPNRFSPLLFMMTVAMLLSGRSIVTGQVSSLPYSDVKAWAVAYRVIVQTKQNCCDIASEETTEGRPDWTIHYSLSRKFEGGFLLKGPIFGFGEPSLPNKRERLRDPVTPAQVEALKANFFKFVGWMEPGPGDLLPISKMRVKIDDDLRSDTKSKECTETDSTIVETYKFDGQVEWNPNCRLGFNMLENLYNIQFPVIPTNEDNAARVVHMLKITNTFTNDPSEKNGAGDSTRDSADKLVKSFFEFSSDSILGFNLNYKAKLENGTKEIHVCKTEKISKVYGLSSRIMKDIMDNQTVSITFQITMKQSSPMSIVLPSLDPGCKPNN